MSDPATPVVDSSSWNKQDPSPLATQQLLRATANLHDLFDAKLSGEIQTLETRINAMDKALALVQDFPTEVDKAIARLKELHEEKFRSIEVILRERKDFDISQKEDVKRAVEAAFNASNSVLNVQRSASELAIAKSENSMKEQLLQLSATATANNRLFESGISDLKIRMSDMESRAKGATALWGYILGGFGLLGVIFALLKGFN